MPDRAPLPGSGVDRCYGYDPDESVDEHLRNAQQLVGVLRTAIHDGLPTADLTDALHRRLARARYQLSGGPARLPATTALAKVVG